MTPSIARSIDAQPPAATANAANSSGRSVGTARRIGSAIGRGRGGGEAVSPASARAADFGVTGAMSAFTIAFQVPNLVRALFADSALQGAFVPVFSELLDYTANVRWD